MKIWAHVSVIRRNNVHIRGSGERTMVFAHGLGCNQDMWRFVARHFEKQYVTVLMEHAGAGGTDTALYRSDTHQDLHGYADDLIEIGRTLKFENATFIGHSCAAMIGALATVKAPHMFESLVLISASPRYVHDGGYRGGFSEAELAGVLACVNDDYWGWASAMAPSLMQNEECPALTEELRRSIRNTNPHIAAEFARVIFASDLRAELPNVRVRSLILQCVQDPVVPRQAADCLRRWLPDSHLEEIPAAGHFPQLSAPELVAAQIRRFISVASRSVEVPWQEAVQGRQGRQPAHDRRFMKALLLRRAQELCLHLDRYDRYARAAGSFLKSDAMPAVVLDIHNRGAATVRRMRSARMDEDTIAEFSEIDQELQALLVRQQRAARNDIVIAPLDSDRAGASVVLNSQNWYDVQTATDQELARFLLLIERDIIKLAALYARLSRCAMKIREFAHRR
jgi:sigma-B regulation protein RsbQ